MKGRTGNSYKNNSAAEYSSSFRNSYTRNNSRTYSENRTYSNRYTPRNSGAGNFSNGYGQDMYSYGRYGNVNNRYNTAQYGSYAGNQRSYAGREAYTNVRAGRNTAYGARQNQPQQYRGYAGSMQYNNTSEAFAYDYLLEPRTIERTRRVVKRSYTRIKENDKLNLPKVFAAVAVIFVLILVSLSFWATNSGKREQIVDLQNQLTLLRNDNKYLNDSITENIDLNKVKAAALELGLQEPAEYQVMKINVPKDSYTVQYSTGEETHYSLLDALKKLFKDWL